MEYNIETLIELLKSLDFISSEEYPDYFYMDSYVNNFHIDAQGDKSYCQIRFIGYKHVEDEYNLPGYDENGFKQLQKTIESWRK